MEDTPTWPSLDDNQRLAWLRLIRTPGVGAAAFQDLINHFGSAQTALDGLVEFTSKRGKPLVPFGERDAALEIEAADRSGARFVANIEAGYPVGLAHSERSPPLLCMRGENTRVAASHAIAIVGSRNASAAGRRLAEQLARSLGQRGIVIASGLARGIDAAAHRGGLETGTVAFLAGGLSQIYPPEHEELADAIVAAGGAIYSETPFGWKARAQDFPRRNRLVAGSSLGLIVVEAAKRSGSLITARQANEMGRTVMAVPGFPLDPRAEGPNSLLRTGAVLVRDSEDVFEEMAPQLRDASRFERMKQQERPSGFFESIAKAPVEPNADAEVEIGIALSDTPISADDLVAATGVPAQAVRIWLLEHELVGKVTRHPGDLFAWNRS